MATPTSGSSSDVDESFSTTSSSSSFSLTLPQILMNEPPPMEPKVEHPKDPFDDAPSDINPDQPLPPRPTSGPWFTFDDIPPSKWRSRILEFNAWLDTQMTFPHTSLRKVIAEFSSHFTRSLREWFFSGLSEYQQKQFLASESISAALVTIHTQFLGNYQLIFQQRKQEFFDRKCCSLTFRDLERHYQQMNHLYHEIGGFKDDNLKLTFIASLPQLIQPEVQRMCGTNIANLKLGEIWQFTLTAVDRMCEQQRLFKKIAKGDKLLKTACSQPFQTKCKDSSCHCHPHRSKHSKHSKHSKKSMFFPRKKNPFRKMRWFKKKSKSRHKSDRCYICGKKGHYAKNCPKKPKQTIALLHQLKVSCPDYDSDHDLESLFSEEDSASPATLFVLPYSDSNSDSHTDSDDMAPVLTIGPPITIKQEPPDFISCPLSPLPLSPNPFDDLSFNEISYCFPDIPSPCKIPTPVSSPSLSDSSSLILFPLSSPKPEESLPSSPDISSVQFSYPVPLISMHVLPDKYEKPVTVTALFDTGSHCTMINPDVLPAHA
ncbi:hypothetical protein JCGZ_24312 [Jatropha curcas]|uniref:CCHC-type domain-containing protein n=1 Tax=Jatropha curcas TaxID=180498 RepID=A0A067JQ75_JATCU|nr:hypothetical protein JCGZ_24312 [Jatropha curcas]